jgi:electron transport complex protein RnfG
MKDAIKMIASLVIFATVACVALAFVYDGTKDTIAAHSAEALKAAQQEIFPDATFTEIAPNTALVSDDKAVIFDVDKDKNGTVTKAQQWKVEKDGSTAGVLIQARSAGFQDYIVALVGVGADGKIAGVRITYDADTPGFGLNAANPQYFVNKATKTTFYDQFTGMSVNKPIKVQKDDGDVIALTGATITSRAVSLLVSQAAKQGSAWLASNGGAPAAVSEPAVENADNTATPTEPTLESADNTPAPTEPTVNADVGGNE